MSGEGLYLDIKSTNSSHCLHCCGPPPCCSDCGLEIQKLMIVVNTDKTEYGLEEIMEITLKSMVNESIRYKDWDTKCSGTAFSIGKKEGRDYYFYPLGLAECLKEEIELMPGTTKKYILNLSEWNNIIGPHSKISAGSYQWKFTYISKNESKISYSNEFTIK